MDKIEEIANAIEEALPESDTFTLAPSQIRRAARAAYEVMASSDGEVGRDDAEWLRNYGKNALLSNGVQRRFRRIADRLSGVV